MSDADFLKQRYAVVIGATNWPRNYHLVYEACFLAPVCGDEF